MAALDLSRILEAVPGIRKDGASYLIPEDLDANLFVSLGQEVVQVPRLERVELQSDLAVLGTHRGERFFFPLDRIVGLKLGSTTTAVRPNAGFHGV